MQLQRVPAGGESFFGIDYRGGELLPFYVPRAVMPQVDRKDLPQLIVKAWEKKLNPTLEVVDPKELHAHQHIDFNLAKNMPIEVKLKPVLVSRDSYILDGNHRWWRNVYDHDSAMNVIRIGYNFEQALDWLCSLPFTYKLAKKIRN
jgi:hypothetical protein